MQAQSRSVAINESWWDDTLVMFTEGEIKCANSKFDPVGKETPSFDILIITAC